MLTTTTTSLKSSWGGNVLVRAESFSVGATATNNAFSIRYAAVPKDICTKFVTVGGNSFNRITINVIISIFMH